MAVTEYIGPLVGPVFADPAEWTPTRSYEALNVVINDGNSYTAKQDVPVGVQITNEDYWLETGNYNAQIERYRQDVLHYTNLIKLTDKCFDTAVGPDSMLQNLDDIEIGTFVRTNGFYKSGIGGAYYKIVSTPPTDDYSHMYTPIEPYGNYFQAGDKYAVLCFEDSISVDALGCVGDDTYVDNNKMLTFAFNFANKCHITLMFGPHTYTLKSPIVINRMSGAKIVGCGTRPAVSQGSVINYIGTGFAITFNVFAFSYMSDISINGNDANNGLKLVSTVLSNFERIYIMHFMTGLSIYKNSGYLHFRSCAFSSYINTEVPYIVIGNNENFEANVVCEYIWFTECSFGGSYINENAIYVYRGQFIWFNSCDICCWNGTAIKLCPINTYDYVRDIFFNNMSFVSNTACILFDTTVNSIQRINITGSIICNTEETTFLQKGSNYINSFEMNISIQELGNGLLFDLQKTNGRIHVNGSQKDYMKSNLLQYEHSAAHPWAVSIPKGTTDITVYAPFSSPYKGKVLCVASSNSNKQPFSIQAEGTLNGNLEANITFASPTTESQTIFIIPTSINF